MSPLRKAIALACAVALAIVAGVVLRGSIGSRTEPVRHEAAPGTPVAPLREPIVDRPGEPYDVGRWANEHDDGEVSPGSRGVGTSTLRLKLVSADDGRTVAMPVRLWRLGLPADEDWLAGDQIQARAEVPPEGATFEQLPAGRYRVECLDARRGAPDPAEFEVRDGANVQTLEIRPRRSHRFQLRIYQEDGLEIRRAVKADVEPWADGERSSWEHAKWARPRAPNLYGFFDGPPQIDQLENDGPHVRSVMVGSRCRGQDAKPREFADHAFRPGDAVEAGPAGFDVGEYRELGEQTLHSRFRTWFQIPGRNTVDVIAGDELGAGGTFIGVSIPLATLTDEIRCWDPDWRDGAKIDCVCRAIWIAWEPPPDALRTIPVHVSIRHPDFEPLDFDWTADTASETHLLVPVDRSER